MFVDDAFHLILVFLDDTAVLHHINFTIFGVYVNDTFIFPESSLNFVQLVFKFAKIRLIIVNQTFDVTKTSLIEHCIRNFL